ncbi:uncharacterized protein LOC123552882 [Mercenaria mercenaria]|uniref:uncharacterized protein LOC123552882 n=1 Tax=Mercenaria mercenaria TaxID=6596 RepID=UPI00234F2123|nr:uncharacterized protein LOC123552882 [Mercenaria mercenaria]
MDFSYQYTSQTRLYFETLILNFRPEQNIFVEMRLGLKFQLVTVITNVKVNPFCGGDWRISIYDTWYCANGPCLNGATCVEIFTNVYRCICTDEWTGTYCENKKPQTTVQSLSTTTTKITTSTAIYKKTSTASGKSTDGSSREYRTNVTDSTYINPTGSITVSFSVAILLFRSLILIKTMYSNFRLSGKSLVTCPYLKGRITPNRK